ncbi:hypothetical protein Tco_0498963 [Tanacetum coccineum]
MAHIWQVIMEEYRARMKAHEKVHKETWRSELRMAIMLQSMDMDMWEIKEKLVERREQMGIRAYEDDKSPVKLSCTKQIVVQYHFIKEQVENGIVELYILITQYQLADLFRKALSKERFEYLVGLLGMRCLTLDKSEVLEKETA